MSSQRKESSRQFTQTTTYRPSMAPRETIIHRTSYGSPAVYGGSSSSSMRSYGYSRGGSSYGGSGSGSGMQEAVELRMKEKKDMQNLNERFASYAAKIRFFNAQNAKLIDAVDALKSRWGKDTERVKIMFETNLSEAGKLTDETERLRDMFRDRFDTLNVKQSELKSQLEQATQDCDIQKQKYQDQCRTVTDLEAEIATLRHRLNLLEMDRERAKAEIARLTDALNRARIDLGKEELAYTEAKNRRQTLEVELENMKHDHDEKIKTLADAAYADTTQENKLLWENEMGNRLRGIQQEYETKFNELRDQLNTSYSLQIQEFQTGATRQDMETGHAREEVKRFKTLLFSVNAKFATLNARNSQLKSEFDSLREEYSFRTTEWDEMNHRLMQEEAKLKAEMEAILKELKQLMDSKLDLEREITVYRRLLDGQDDKAGLRQIVDNIIEQQESQVSQASSMYSQTSQTKRTVTRSSTRMSQFESGEITAKTTYQRNAKGPVSITECEGNGAFVTLENQGRKSEDLADWSIRRVVDGREYCNVALDDDLEIRSGGKIKLYANGSMPMGASRNDREVEIDTWGRGINVTTSLLNPHGEERATHQQTTRYS